MYHLIHEKLQVFYELGIIRKNDRRIRNIQTVLEGKNEIQIDNWGKLTGSQWRIQVFQHFILLFFNLAMLRLEGS